MPESLLLVLLAPADRRDDLVDALMDDEDVSGFTLTPALGYSRDHGAFSPGEQVAGYRDYVRFEVLLDPRRQAHVLDLLERAGGSERLRYWLTPIPETGHLPR